MKRCCPLPSATYGRTDADRLLGVETRCVLTGAMMNLVSESVKGGSYFFWVGMNS